MWLVDILTAESVKVESETYVSGSSSQTSYSSSSGSACDEQILFKKLQDKDGQMIGSSPE